MSATTSWQDLFLNVEIMTFNFDGEDATQTAAPATEETASTEEATPAEETSGSEATA